MTSPRAVATLVLSLIVFGLCVAMARLDTDRGGLFANPGRPAQAAPPRDPAPTPTRVQHIL